MSNPDRPEPSELTDPRIFYLVPEDQGGRIVILDLLVELWKRKFVILGVGFAFALSGVAYSLLATEWYRSETVVIPAHSQAGQGLGSQLGGLGGFASLAGLDLGNGVVSEALSVLHSRKFAREFIQDNDLMPVFFEELWDPETRTWSVDDPGERPDIRDAVKVFQGSVLDVREMTADGTIVVAAEWTNPELASAWSSEIVRRVNERMRADALREAEASIEFLGEQLSEANLEAVRAGTARILESEIQKLTLAKGRADFAFKIVDPAVTPKSRERPKRKMIVLLAGFFGVVLASFVAVLRILWRDDA